MPARGQPCPYAAIMVLDKPQVDGWTLPGSLAGDPEYAEYLRWLAGTLTGAQAPNS
jgi:hypothetical protein